LDLSAELACKAKLDRPASKVLEVLKETKAIVVYVVHKAFVVKKAFQDLVDLVVTKEIKASVDHQASLVPVVFPEFKGKQAIPDPLDLEDLLVCLVNVGCLVLRESVANVAPLEHLVPEDLVVLLESLESQVQLERKDQQGILVSVALKESAALSESVAPRAKMGPMERKAKGVCVDFQARLAFQDAKVPEVRKEQQVSVCQAHQVDPALAGSQACKDQLVAEVQEELMAALACLARRVKMVRTAKMASMVRLDHRAKKVLMVRRDPKATVAKASCKYI